MSDVIVKISKEARQVLKVIAAKKGVTMTQALSDLVLAAERPVHYIEHGIDLSAGNKPYTREVCPTQPFCKQ